MLTSCGEYFTPVACTDLLCASRPLFGVRLHSFKKGVSLHNGVSLLMGNFMKNALLTVQGRCHLTLLTTTNGGRHYLLL